MSLLDRLKAPKPSELSRKRKVLCKGKKKSSGSRALKTKLKVHPSSEFAREELTVSLGRLFCKACREHLSVKRSTVMNHVKSIKHVNSQDKLKTKQTREINLATALKRYDESVRPVGETLPEEQRVYRIKVLTTFMKIAVLLVRLTEPSHMLDLVPFILGEEKAQIKEEIKGKYLSIIFDGKGRYWQ